MCVCGGENLQKIEASECSLHDHAAFEQLSANRGEMRDRIVKLASVAQYARKDPKYALSFRPSFRGDQTLPAPRVDIR